MKMSGQLYAPASLPLEKYTRYLLDRRLGKPQNLSGLCREINILDYREWNSDPLVICNTD
jgi:hypothetical protein